MSTPRPIGRDEVLTAAACCAAGRAYRVFLDGIERHQVIRAECGMIERYKEMRDGRQVEFFTETLGGEVSVIELPGRAP